jgi:fumarate reductase (CoM/CoB) subunit A
MEPTVTDSAGHFFRTVETDVLVVGGGLAALRAAISARQVGARVLVAVKRLLGRSGSSALTTGGYAAALPDLNARDDRHLHYVDTVVGGGFVNERALVHALVDDAPARLTELWEFGAPFRKRDGRYHLSPSGDHSQARVLVPQNMRGGDMTLPMRDMASALGIEVLENCVITDLLQDEDRVLGAVGIARNRIEGFVIQAGAIVLAAGGAGRMFTITSNPADVCGAGFALALRAGARLRDMEFIQFYPWRLIRPFKSTRVPIQPSTFSIGGRLYNSKGERFMEAYDPVRKDATTRDLSARGIFEQIRAGHSIEGGVILDVSRVPDDQFRYENSKLVQLLDPKKIDYRSIELIVAPEAHFFMGGVLIDESGHCDLRGLYAAGENAGGTHGGNRLNSNAVPDTQVFGHRAGVAAARQAQVARARKPNPAPTVKSAARLQAIRSDSATPAPEFGVLHEQLKLAMTLGIGIVRTAQGLERAIADAAFIAERLAGVPVQTLGDLTAAIEIEDLCSIGAACALSALARKESRAAHYRDDFPQADPAWVRTITYDRNGIGERPLAVDPDEARLIAMHEAARKVSAKPAEPEYIE